MPGAGLGLTAVALIALAGSAGATHRVDHRYVLLGYVRDAMGRPVPWAAVRLVREKTGLAYDAETDAEGLYLVIVHLHDEDLGDPLVLALGPATFRVGARFDPLDPRTPRGTRVDFIAGEGWERRDDFVHTLERYLKE
ncbi:MAG: carboxypeptidase-like regulatory domain-containing protein [Candidatus Rokuibacteriota bacterium]